VPVTSQPVAALDGCQDEHNDDEEQAPHREHVEDGRVWRHHGGSDVIPLRRFLHPQEISPLLFRGGSRSKPAGASASRGPRADRRGADAAVRRRGVQPGVGARVLRRDRGGEHVDAPVEVKHLRRCDVDLARKLLFVRRSKNESSHRVIPLNGSALNALARMFERADALGHNEPEHYLWPSCQWGRFDAAKPMLKWDTAWRDLRDAAGLQRLRFHDLRHTAITELAEMSVADRVLESITGHLSRRMLEHYSHIRIDAKRQALDALDVQRGRVLPEAGSGNGSEPKIEMPESVTSQSDHSLTLSGSPPHGKLLIPFERRDVRVVEGARLESASAHCASAGAQRLRTQRLSFGRVALHRPP